MCLLRIFLQIAPLFSRVSAGLTSNESDSDIKTLFENFIRELCSVKSKMANQQRK